MTIDFKTLLDSSAFTRQQAESLIRLSNATVAEAAAAVPPVDLSAIESDISALQALTSTLSSDVATLQTSVAALQAALPTTKVLPSNVVSSSNVTFTNVSGLSIPLAIGQRIFVRFVFTVVTSTQPNGMRLRGALASANSTYALNWTQGSGNGAGFLAGPITSSFTTASPGLMYPVTEPGCLCVIEGIINPTTVTGSFALEFACEDASTTLTIKAGGFAEYRVIA